MTQPWIGVHKFAAVSTSNEQLDPPVKHKSGVGPRMVVAAVDPEGIACTWIARDGQFKTHFFSAGSLLSCEDDPFSSSSPKLQKSCGLRRTGSKRTAGSKLKIRPLQT
jgi:uncharacterized protein YodC (DUF2158 family)